MNARITSRRPPATTEPDEPVVHGVLRSMLRWPGALLDLWDGRVQPIAGVDAPSPEDPRTPDAGYAHQAGLTHLRRGEDHVACRIEQGTALIVGGLQAPRGRQAALLQHLVAVTRDAGVRRHAIYPVRDPDRALVHQAGFATLGIGSEAWVDLDGFTLRGKRWADLRQMRNRARKRGVHAEETAPGPWDDAMRAVWNAFVHSKQPRWELRWLTGTPSLDVPGGRRYFVAHKQGRLHAFCTLLPGPDGTWSVDVLCRHPDAVPGSMERLLVHAFTTLRDEGASAVNLGPCPLAGLERWPPGLLGALFRWAWSSPVAERLFGLRGLHAFKSKFQPRWEPVHLGLSPRVGWVPLYATARIWAFGG